MILQFVRVFVSKFWEIAPGWWFRKLTPEKFCCVLCFEILRNHASVVISKTHNEKFCWIFEGCDSVFFRPHWKPDISWNWVWLFGIFVWLDFHHKQKRWNRWHRDSEKRMNYCEFSNSGKDRKRRSSDEKMEAYANGDCEISWDNSSPACRDFTDIETRRKAVWLWWFCKKPEVFGSLKFAIFWTKKLRKLKLSPFSCCFDDFSKNLPPFVREKNDRKFGFYFFGPVLTREDLQEFLRKPYFYIVQRRWKMAKNDNKKICIDTRSHFSEFLPSTSFFCISEKLKSHPLFINRDPGNDSPKLIHKNTQS